MKLTELKIEGFRSLKNVVWKPGDLNVVIGPNAGGKSNLLKALELISCSARGKLGDYVQGEGGMQAIAWNGTGKIVKFAVKASDPITEKFARDTDIDGYYLKYDFALTRRGPEGTFYVIGDEKLAGTRVSGSSQATDFLIQRSPKGDFITEGLMEPAQLFENHLEIAGSESMVSALRFPNEGWLPTIKFPEFLATWVIHQNFSTKPNATIRQSVVTRFETRIEPDGANLIQFLHTLCADNPEFRNEMNRAMIAAFGAEFQELNFPPAADQRIQMRLKWRSLSKSHASEHLSDGTLRFLFLIAILANPNPPSLIAIDEPEIGLHPSMLPLVAELAAQAATRTQVVLTTHSTDFLSAFNDLDNIPTVTIVESRDGQTELRQPADDSLKYWVEKYNLGELYRSGELEAIP